MSASIRSKPQSLPAAIQWLLQRRPETRRPAFGTSFSRAVENGPQIHEPASPDELPRLERRSARTGHQPPRQPLRNADAPWNRLSLPPPRACAELLPKSRTDSDTETAPPTEGIAERPCARGPLVVEARAWLKPELIRLTPTGNFSPRVKWRAWCPRMLRSWRRIPAKMEAPARRVSTPRPAGVPP